MKQKIPTPKAVRLKLLFFSSHLRNSISPALFKQKGYSFVEILTALAITGILTVIIVPNTRVWIDHYRLNGAARLVWGDLQSAKMTAIKNNQTITVTFNSTTSYSFSQGGSTIFTRYLTQEYPTITVVKNGGGVLTFGPTGLTQNATITVQGSEESKTVTTLWTGRILST
ncbi:MAG: GspH/FimT family pseudopilin [Deltaproteobacteria bacterium]|nr:GspH/FimT family pseudopilin [Deltaproteobacteria bacterium]